MIHRCTRCIMDDRSDDKIWFDEEGRCNYCIEALKAKAGIYFPNEVGHLKIEELIKTLKKERQGQRYDCLMGLSGGLDSSYLAYLGAAKWGLRIAAVHIDDGYDTEISVSNLNKLCQKAKIEIFIIRPDKEQYNALMKAYMKAGVPNLAVPQDNILFANLYKFARKNNIKNFLSGSNFALECILQAGNTWDAYDLVNLHAIHKKFGEQPIDKLTFISSWRKEFDKRFLKLKTLRPLNFIDYNRNKAFSELKEFCGFEYYGRKHLENYLTAFVQLYWLPKKFNVDKRTSHLSSMIVSGQMTREETLLELEEPLYEEAYMEKVKNMICENMKISQEELEALVAAPGKQHNEYRTQKLFPTVQKAYAKFKK